MQGKDLRNCINITLCLLYIFYKIQKFFLHDQYGIDRLNACFYVLNTNKDTVPFYPETRKIILEQPNINQIFQTYSISTIEVLNKLICSNA